MKNGGLAQGDDKPGEKGTNTIFVMAQKEIARIPKNKVISYAKVVQYYRE